MGTNIDLKFGGLTSVDITFDLTSDPVQIVIPDLVGVPSKTYQYAITVDDAVYIGMSATYEFHIVVDTTPAVCLDTPISIATIPDHIIIVGGACTTTIPIDVTHPGDNGSGDAACGAYGHDLVDAEMFTNIVKNGAVYGVKIAETSTDAITDAEIGLYTFIVEFWFQNHYDGSSLTKIASNEFNVDI